MTKKEIMKSTPNTLETFTLMMELAHNVLHNETGKNYSVVINFKEDCVVLYEVGEDD